MQKIVASNELIDMRLDKAISLSLSDTSRSKIQEYLEKGLILVNDKTQKASYKLRSGDVITIDDIPVESMDVKPEDIPLDVVYEDDDVIVINKPKGLVVHPGAGNKEHTLANALKFYSDSLSTLNGEFRPGIVHRIDKDTAGLLLVAKNDKAHAFLAEQLSGHTLGRNYIALVQGIIVENDGKIIAPIGRDKKFRQKMAVDLINGKEAETSFKVIERFEDSTLVECKLKTGRTHQIRVHMNYIGHPLVGDLVYGKGNKGIYKEGQLLFAHEIHFIHPRSKKEMTFKVDLPSYFNNVLESLRK